MAVVGISRTEDEGIKGGSDNADGETLVRTGLDKQRLGLKRRQRHILSDCIAYKEPTTEGIERE